MGFFSDIKDARPIEPTDIAVVPAQRLDTLVMHPASATQRRRTDYAGTVWYGGRPQLIGDSARSGPSARVESPFWLPDSHAYEARDVQIQAVAALQCALSVSSGSTSAILEIDAALGENPADPGVLRLFVILVAIARLPLGITYRVTVI